MAEQMDVSKISQRFPSWESVDATGLEIGVVSALLSELGLHGVLSLVSATCNEEAAAVAAEQNDLHPGKWDADALDRAQRLSAYAFALGELTTGMPDPYEDDDNEETPTETEGASK